jgi:hypothetical protein
MNPLEFFNDPAILFSIAIGLFSGIAIFKVGQAFGYSSGFKDGVRRGLRFSALKESEETKGDFVNGFRRN